MHTNEQFLAESAEIFNDLRKFKTVVHNADDLTYHELLYAVDALVEKNEQWIDLALPHASPTRYRGLLAAMSALSAPGFEARWTQYRAGRK